MGQISTADQEHITRLKADGSDVLVLVDGQVDVSNSRFSGKGIKPLIDVWAGSVSSHWSVMESLLSALERTEDVNALLNIALMLQGSFIYVSENQRHPNSIHLVHVASNYGRMTPLFNFIVLEEGAQAEVTEWYLGESNQWIQVMTACRLRANAELHWARVNVSSGADCVGGLWAEQEEDSVLAAVGVSSDVPFLRENWVFDQNGERARSLIAGAMITARTNHCDYRVDVRHHKPKGQSEQFFRSLAAGQSRCIFNGKIFIDLDAQEVQAKQSHASLLLSDTAEVDTRPELDIRADNVKANHGASVGQLDKEQLFYLQARGLSKTMSERLLARGFVQKVLERVVSPEARAVLNHSLSGIFHV